MKQAKKILLALGAMVVLASIGWAAWSAYLSDGMTAHVVSTGDTPLQLSVALSDLELNTTAASAYGNSTLTIDNTNGQLLMDFNASVVKIDVPDACTDYEGDVDVTYYWSSSTSEPSVLDQVDPGDQLDMPSGLSYLTVRFDAVKLSCPQDVNVTVLLSQ